MPARRVRPTTRRPKRPAPLARDFTYRQYEDPGFAEEFRKRRGNRPRPYELRLLRRLLAVARTRRRLLNLKPRQPLLVLDLGTGYGRDLAWLQAQPGIHAVGNDYSLSMLQAAKGHLSLKSGTLAQIDVRWMGIRDACVDAARAQALFHHLPNDAAEAAMGEVARVLKPGGIAQFFVREGTRRGLLNEPGLGPRYFRYFTLKTLQALVRRHGLAPIEHERVIAKQQFPCLALLAEKSLP